MDAGETWYLCDQDYDGPVEIVDAEPLYCAGLVLVQARLDNGVIAAVNRDYLVRPEHCRTGWGHA